MVSREEEPSKMRMMYRRMYRSKHVHITNTSRSSNLFHGLKYLTANLMQMSKLMNHLVTEQILLGFGCSNTSVCFKIFSVQCLVHSALVRRFSKCASNSVFSAWPNFSSVNCMRRQYLKKKKKKKKERERLED